MAGATAVLFLVCQGMAATHAAIPGGQDAQAAAESCHDHGQPPVPNTAKGTCQANWESQNAPSGASLVGIHSVTDLPVIANLDDRIAAVAESPPPPESPLLRVEPPPLRTLNCCLRN